MGDEKPASRQYSSFLIRCWRLDAGVQRIKIEHIQSGLGVQVSTLSSATEWIVAHWNDTPKDEAATTDGTNQTQADGYLP